MYLGCLSRRYFNSWNYLWSGKKQKIMIKDKFNIKGIGNIDFVIDIKILKKI